MKSIVILVDGMADYPIKSLGDKTPLEVANIPNIHALAATGEIGLVQTIPLNMSPGSDVANLSVMGYDPKQYHTGRSPLEAASMGIDLLDTDLTFRCNLVTVSDGLPFAQKTMIDHSAGEITTAEAQRLILDLRESLQTKTIRFYPGVSYRHLIVWDQGPDDFILTPPHDILEQKVTAYLPQGKHSSVIMDMMEKGHAFLKDHPINLDRMARGLNPANAIWIWGEGRKPSLTSFSEKYGVKGSVISAVDLINGIGILAGLTPIAVEGATGTLHTNFKGKAAAASKALLEGDDFVYLHIEAPDECGHQGDLEGKIRSIERIDEWVVGPICTALSTAGEDYRMLILPDHRTPIALRTHSSEPVPYVLYNSAKPMQQTDQQFTETSAESSGRFISEGHTLLSYFFKV